MKSWIAPLKLLLLYGQLELQLFLLSDVILLNQHCWGAIYWVLQLGSDNIETLMRGTDSPTNRQTSRQTTDEKASWQACRHTEAQRWQTNIHNGPEGKKLL